MLAILKAADFGHLHMAADLRCKFDTSPLSSLHNMNINILRGFISERI